MPTLTPTVEISVLSDEYLTVTFTSDVDPQALGTVEMAFTTGHNDAPEALDWETAAVNGSTMRIMVGPTGVALPIGFYLVWTRIDAGTETPVEAIGHLRIF